MKRKFTLFSLGLFLLVWAHTASAINITVPSAPNAGYILRSTSTGAYVATTSLDLAGIISVGGVPVVINTRAVNTGGILSGGGDLSSDRTITLSTSTLYALFSGTSPITFNTSTGAITFTNPGYITTSTYNASITIATAAPLGGGGKLSDNGTLSLTCATCLTTSTGLTVTNFASANISQWTNNSGYITTSTATSTITAAGGTATGPTFTFASSGPLLAISCAVGTCTFTTPATSTILSGYSTTTGANPSASVGLSAVNGTANTFLRSDGAPAIDQAITPNWTGLHQFTGEGVSSTQFRTPSATIATLLDDQGNKYSTSTGGGSGNVIVTAADTLSEYVPFWTTDASTTLSTTSLIFNDVSASRVGIRTAQPSTTLGVEGGADINGSFQLWKDYPDNGSGAAFQFIPDITYNSGIVQPTIYSLAPKLTVDSGSGLIIMTVFGNSGTNRINVNPTFGPAQYYFFRTSPVFVLATSTNIQSTGLLLGPTIDTNNGVAGTSSVLLGISDSPTLRASGTVATVSSTITGFSSSFTINAKDAGSVARITLRRGFVAQNGTFLGTGTKQVDNNIGFAVDPLHGSTTISFLSEGATTTFRHFGAGIFGATTTPSSTLHVVGASSTVYIGTATLPGCLVMGDTDSGGLSYITVLNGVLSATTTKPNNCQ